MGYYQQLFDSVTPPALPSDWNSNTSGSSSCFATSAAAYYTPPNALTLTAGLNTGNPWLVTYGTDDGSGNSNVTLTMGADLLIATYAAITTYRTGIVFRGSSPTLDTSSTTFYAVYIGIFNDHGLITNWLRFSKFSNGAETVLAAVQVAGGSGFVGHWISLIVNFNGGGVTSNSISVMFFDTTTQQFLTNLGTGQTNPAYAINLAAGACDNSITTGAYAGFIAQCDRASLVFLDSFARTVTDNPDSDQVISPLIGTGALSPLSLSYGPTTVLSPLTAVGRLLVSQARDYNFTLSPLTCVGHAVAPIRQVATQFQVAPLIANVILSGGVPHTDTTYRVSPQTSSAGMVGQAIPGDSTRLLTPLAAAGHLTAVLMGAISPIVTTPLVGRGVLPPLTIAGVYSQQVAALRGAGSFLPNVSLQSNTDMVLGLPPIIARGVMPLAGSITVIGVPLSPLAGTGIMVDLGMRRGMTVHPSPLSSTGFLSLRGTKHGRGVTTSTAILRLLAVSPGSLRDSGSLYDPNAWKGIGPEAEGSNYPFLSPSRNIRHLIAAASLNYRANIYNPPLQLSWVTGLRDFLPGVAGLPPTPVPEPGDDPPPQPVFSGGLRRKIHPCDVLVHDAVGNVAFDSSSAEWYAGQQYGPYLYMHRWGDHNSTMLIVQRTKFPRPALAYNVPYEISPSNAIFSERVGELCCKQITSATGEGSADVITGDLFLSAGYNTSLVGTGPLQRGVTRLSEITIGFPPGAGAGTYPDCSDVTSLPLLEINQTGPSALGNFQLVPDGCYSFRPKLSLKNGNAVIADGKIVVGNNCQPCCTCQDYANLATIVVRLWNELKSLAAETESVRDDFRTGLQRWQQLYDANAGQFIIQPVAVVNNVRYIDLVVQICYTGDACAANYNLDIVTTIQGANSEGMGVSLMSDYTYMTDLCGGESQVIPASAGYGPSGNANSVILYNGAQHIVVGWAKMQPRVASRIRLRYAFSAVNTQIPTPVLFTLSGQQTPSAQQSSPRLYTVMLVPDPTSR